MIPTGPFVQSLHRFFSRLFGLLAVLATLCGVAIVALVATSVSLRHVALTPIRFTEELVGLLMTAAFFLALPLVTLKAEHVRVQILVNALPRHLARWLGVVAALLGVAFTLWFFWLCLPWLEFAYKRNIKTEVGRLLMYPWMLLPPLSMLLTAVAFAWRAVAREQPDARAASAPESL